MEELIRLLKDGRSRTLEMLAIDLGTSVEKVKRDIEFLEHTGVIKRIEFTETCSQSHSCDGCTAAAQEASPVPPVCRKADLRTWVRCGKLNETRSGTDFAAAIHLSGFS